VRIGSSVDISQSGQAYTTSCSITSVILTVISCCCRCRCAPAGAFSQKWKVDRGLMQRGAASPQYQKAHIVGVASLMHCMVAAKSSLSRHMTLQALMVSFSTTALL
jgi:hypothetical protein